MLKPKNLLTHPRNMRRFYPSKDVQEMANSIAAAGGVLQSMIVVKNGKDHSHKYFVVDGNVRLAGANLLGDKCPPLKCEVVTQSKAEQQLSMIIANQIRYDVDPVSEGIHYKALHEEGLSCREISKRTGIYEVVVVDDTMRQLIHDQVSEHELAGYARRNAPSIRDDGKSKILAGITSVQEVLRVTLEE